MMLISVEFSRLITITNPLLMMIPWSSQQNPTSDPDRIMGSGMWRVHLSLNVCHIPIIGSTKKQYIIDVSRRPKRCSTLAGSSTFVGWKNTFCLSQRLTKSQISKGKCLFYLWICDRKANERSCSDNFQKTSELPFWRWKVNVQGYINHHNGKSHSICLKRRVIVKHLAETNVETRAEKKITMKCHQKT